MAITSPPEPVTREPIAIESDRYQIIRLIGQGGWADVYEALDTYTQRPVALKAFNLSPVAQAQLLASGKTIDDIVTQHAEFINNAPNLVPRWADRDEHGVRLLISPLYKETLAERVEREAHFFVQRREQEKYGPIATESYTPTMRVPELLPSGLPLERILEYATDIIAGIEQFHKQFKETHRDLKLENMVVDGTGKVLLNDFESADGTLSATHTHMVRGHEYTRAPRLWDEKQQPSRNADAYGFSSVLFKLFTGKYLFEEKLRAMDALQAKQFMLSLQDSRTLEDTIQKEQSFSAIPQQFQQVIISAARGYAQPEHAASFIQRGLQHAIDEYKKEQAFKHSINYKVHVVRDSVADVAKAVYDFVRQPLKLGLAVAGLAAAGYGLWKLSTIPPLPQPTGEIETLNEPYKGIERGRLRFFVPGRNSVVDPRLEGTYTIKQEWLDGRRWLSHGTVYDSVAAIVYQTAQELNYRFDDLGIRVRYSREIRTEVNAVRPVQTLSEYLETVMRRHQIAQNTVALEQALIEALYGPELLNQFNALRTRDLVSYSDVKDPRTRMPIFSPEQASLLSRSIDQISHVMHRRVWDDSWKYTSPGPALAR